MKLKIATTLALAAAPALAIPPENFGFPSAPNDTILNLAYRQTSGPNGYITVQPGALYGVDVPELRPVISVNTTAYSSLSSYTGNYVVIMVDPDASTPQNASSRFILHYLAGNFTQSTNLTISSNLTVTGRHLVNSSAPLIAYNRPRPPTTSSAHRYIWYAFAQPANFAIPATFSSLNETNRARFNLTNFIRDASLGTPLAANYFFVSNQTGVPGNFTAAAGGQYPGGNGAAITSGTAAPSASASASSSVSSGLSASAGSATATSTSRAAAAVVTGMSGLVGAGLIGLAALL